MALAEDLFATSLAGDAALPDGAVYPADRFPDCSITLATNPETNDVRFVLLGPWSPRP